MKRTLAALAVSVLFISGGSASATPHAPHCKVLSVQTVQQTRNMNGIVVGIVNNKPVFGRGYQHRTQTTTTERCRGKVSTSVAYTPWTY